MYRFMKNIKFLWVVLFAFLIQFTAISQGTLSLKINEVMVNNDSTLVDNYGNRSGWIEIFNPNYYSANLEGMYLTNDTTNKTKYSITKNDPSTAIPARGYYIFFADNKPYRGTQHLNFNLFESDYVALYDADGKKLIDILDIPAEIKQLRDKTYGRIVDGEDECGILSRYTPNNPNDWVVRSSKSQEIAKIDPSGVGMILISMAVVFLCLVLIFILLKVFQLISIHGASFKMFSKKTSASQDLVANADTLESSSKTKGQISGEVIAAIGTALYYYANQFHDEESEIITIDHTKRSYSPWGNKHLVMKKSTLKPRN